MSELPFPRHSARTLRFSLGAPRNFTISPDGQRVVFVRSGSGTDRTGRLFELDLNSKSTREIVNPLDLLKSNDEKISIEEQARRERAREAAGGITNYSNDSNLKKVAFALSGKLYVANLEDGKVLQWPAQEPVIDPQFAPDGSAVGYINPSGEMRLSDGVSDRAIFSPEKNPVNTVVDLNSLLNSLIILGAKPKTGSFESTLKLMKSSSLGSLFMLELYQLANNRLLRVYS